MGATYSDRGATGAGDGTEKTGAATIGGGRFLTGMSARGTRTMGSSNCPWAYLSWFSVGHSSTGLLRGSSLTSTLGARSSCLASSARMLRKLGGVTDGLGKMKDGAAIGTGENGIEGVRLRQGEVLGDG